MTEEVSNVEVMGQQEQPVQNTPAQAAQIEKMIPASRMNEVVHQRTKEASQKAYERGLAEAKANFEREQSQVSSMGGIQQADEERIRQMMASVFKEQHAEMQREFQKAEAQRQIQDLTNSYMGKLNAAQADYPELLKRQDEIADLATLIPFINEHEEAAGVTQHLLDNGAHVASLLVLSQTSPTFLRRELKKLADSIKNNENAKNMPRINEPLSQPTASHYTADSDSASIEALKKQPWLRG